MRNNVSVLCLRNIFAFAFILVCFVLAVPAAVSAAEAASTPEYDNTVSGSEAFYGNGTSFDVYPKENDTTKWLVVWGWGENFEPAAGEFAEIPVNTPIYAGSKDEDVVPGDDNMSITLQGVTVPKLYLHGKDSHSVAGEVDLFLEDGAAITDTLDVSGNEAVMIRFYKGAKIAENATVTGAGGRAEPMGIEFVRGSGMTKAALADFFPGIDVAEILAADIIVGENGSVQGGKIEESTLAYIGSPLLDPDYDEESEWMPIPNQGYKFDGWYLNGTRIDLFKTPMTEAHFANAPVNEDGIATVTVYAKWVPVSPDTGLNEMGGVMMALIILTGAAAGITGGVLMMRRRSSAR